MMENDLEKRANGGKAVSLTARPKNHLITLTPRFMGITHHQQPEPEL